MPMRLLIILQLILIFILYTVLVIGLPALVFHKKAARFRFAARIFIYLTIGNFYLMNLVFLLQLLHISNRFTLIFFTVAPGILAAMRINRVSFIQRLRAAETGVMKLTLGFLGVRTFLWRFFGQMKRMLLRILGWCFQTFSRRPLETILVVLMSAAVVYMYAVNSLSSYGYLYSDLPVHNYWINAMEDNEIFVAGVYPFGFHCIIYYIHKVFSIDTYVLLRLFGVIQTLYIHLMLLGFLKSFCRSRYVPYLACGGYVLFAFFNSYCTERFHSTLPQEYGMLFILPSIFFALEFFRVKKEELKRGKQTFALDGQESPRVMERAPAASKKKKRFRVNQLSDWYLIGYALSFSMTLAVHFYDTMIAGLFCVAIALGFFVRFFRPRYLGRVLAAFFLSLAIAAAPMVAAFAMGTPLQGSLFWGLEVMTKSGDKDAEADQEAENSQGKQTEADNDKKGGSSSEEGGNRGLTEESAPKDGSLEMDQGRVGADSANNGTKAEEAQKVSLSQWIQDTFAAMAEHVDNYLAGEGLGGLLSVIGIGSTGLFLLGFLSLLRKRFDYGMLLVSVGIYTGLLIILLCLETLGLPQLMDANRSRIYVAYLLPVSAGLLLDGILYTFFGWVKKQWIYQGLSLVCCVCIAAVLYERIPLRRPIIMEALEPNGAITCVSSILSEEKPGTFTIVSANDELRMIEEKGYHVQLSVFLAQMEGIGKYTDIIIPTKTVYFFVEKVPLDYTVKYENSGQRVSEEGARKKLPQLTGLNPYVGENRWIVMSRMSYWVQAFQSLYPNDCGVYYEDDEFICYYVEQNEYSLFNFALDYGYNM